MSTWITPSDIPDDFPVRPILGPGWPPAPGIAVCGHCGLGWDDTVATEYTPAPGARCPFEAFHHDDEPWFPFPGDGPDEDDDEYVATHEDPQHDDWPLRSTCLTIDVGRDEDGILATVVRFADGSTLVSGPDDPALGFEPEANVLHDVAHALIACHAGITSPVLERVIEARSLSQYEVDLEEAAAFALQAWVASLLHRDARPAISNAQQSLASAVLADVFPNRSES